MSKKHLEDSLGHMKEIHDFCVEREERDDCKALLYISSIFESTATLFQLLYDKADTLEFKIPGKSEVIDSNRQINYLIIDQSRFTYITTLSILEFTAKNLSLKEGLPVEAWLKKNKKNKTDIYLKDIVSASASEDLGLLTAEEESELLFFIHVRNALVHNNAIPDKEDLGCEVYGKLYSFKKGQEINSNTQTLFIFSKRAIELFYDWSQKHEKLIKA